MTEAIAKPCTAFIDDRQAASGPLVEVALALKDLAETEPSQPRLAFDDATGRVVDLDLRGTKTEIVERLLRSPPSIAASSASAPEADEKAEQSAEKTGPGRPKLGVTAREVTLLPRHWEWLAAQPGGASVTLRKLVEDARRNTGAQQKLRQAQEAAYRFMAAMAGDFPGFEEATRALFADDRDRFEQHMTEWPVDIRNYAIRLGFGGMGL